MDLENQETPPVAEEQATEAVAPEVPVAKDFPSEATAREDGTLHGKVDEVHGKLDQLHAHQKAMDDKLDMIDEKCVSMGAMIKSYPAPIATDISALEAKLEAMEKTLEAVQKTLEINLHISTEEVRNLLQADSLKETPVTKNKYWARDYFGYSKEDDLGGQQ